MIDKLQENSKRNWLLYGQISDVLFIFSALVFLTIPQIVIKNPLRANYDDVDAVFHVLALMLTAAAVMLYKWQWPVKDECTKETYDINIYKKRVACFAITEAITLLGCFLSAITSSPEKVIPFAVITVGLLVYMFPRPERVRRKL